MFPFTPQLSLKPALNQCDILIFYYGDDLNLLHPAFEFVWGPTVSERVDDVTDHPYEIYLSHDDPAMMTKTVYRRVALFAYREGLDHALRNGHSLGRFLTPTAVDVNEGPAVLLPKISQILKFLEENVRVQQGVTAKWKLPEDLKAVRQAGSTEDFMRLVAVVRLDEASLQTLAKIDAGEDRRRLCELSHA
ncbi:unnamed protein product [Amoebophrya sp. A25]|nr:unnamed protein product [Amoebophrya sp. A25]|eukprot:GSA25T00014615001.1